jgi:hypothetical protein
MHTAGKLRQSLAFFAGAALATVVSDAVVIAISGALPSSKGLVHHVEFLATLMVLVGLAGAVGLHLPPRRDLPPRLLVALGALAAVLGFAIGVAAAPHLGATASIAVIVVVGAAVPALASRWARTR